MQEFFMGRLGKVDKKRVVTTAIAKSSVSLEAEEYEDALQEVEGALKYEPKHPEALLYKAQALKGLKRYNEALECIERVLYEDPQNIQALALTANLFYLLKKFREAIKLSKEILTRDPKNTEVLYIKAHSLFVLNKLAKAQACAEAIVKIDPNNARVHVIAAFCKLEQGINFYNSYSKEYEEVEQLLFKEPSKLFSYHGEIKGMLLALLGRYEEVSECFGAMLPVLEREVRLARYGNERAIDQCWVVKSILWEMKGRYEEALKCLEQTSGEGEIAWKKGKCLLQLRRYEEAIKSFEKVRPSPLVPYGADALRGIALFCLGKYSEAKNYFVAALKFHEENIDALQGIAMCYLQNGETHLAERMFAKIDAVLSKSSAKGEVSYFYNQRGHLFAAVKKEEAAEEMFNKALKTLPDHRYAPLCSETRYQKMQDFYKRLIKEEEAKIAKDPYFYAKGWIRKAVAHMCLGNFAQAVECLEVIVQENKKNVQLFTEVHFSVWQIGTIFLAQGAYKKAIKYSGQCIALVPQGWPDGDRDERYAPPFLIKAEAFLRMGNFVKAEKYAQKVLSLKLPEGIVWKRLGGTDYARIILAESYRMQGKSAEAVECLEKLSSFNKSTEVFYVYKGLALFSAGRFSEASPCFDSALEQPHEAYFYFSSDYKYIHALQGKAICRFYQKDLHAFEELLLQVEWLLEKEGSLLIKTEVLNQRGDLFLALKENDRAIAAYEKVLTLDPNDAYAKKRLGELRGVLKNISAEQWEKESLSYADKGRYKEALFSIEQALEQDEKNIASLLMRASYLRVLERYEEALETSNKVLALDPENQKAFQGRIFCLCRLNRCEEALPEGVNKKLVSDTGKSIEPDPEMLWLESNGQNKVIDYGVFNAWLEVLPQVEEAQTKEVDVLSDICDASMWGALGNFSKAIKCAERPLYIDSRFEDAWYLISNARRLQGNYHGAIEAAQKAEECSVWMRSVPGLPSLLVVSDCLMRRGKYSDALQNIAKALKVTEYSDRFEKIPVQHDHAWCLHGRIMLRMGSYHNARSSFTRALDINPHNKSAMLNKGIAYFCSGEFENAQTYFNKALELDSTYKYALQAKAVLLFHHEKHEEANVLFARVDALLMTETSSLIVADMWNQRGILFAAINRVDFAHSAFQKAHDSDPNDFYSSQKLGLESKDETAAEVMVPSSIINNPEELWIVEENEIPLSVGLYQHITQQFDEMRRGEINNPDVGGLMMTGFMWGLLGNYTRALICADKAIEWEPQFFAGWYLKSNTFRLMGNYPEALRCATEALKFADSIREAKEKDFVRLIKTDVLIRMGNYAEAEKCMAESMAYALHGQLWLRQGNYSQALESFNQALKQDPKNKEALVKKGLILISEGNIKEALSCFQEALTENGLYLPALQAKAVCLSVDKEKSQESRELLEEVDCLLGEKKSPLLLAEIANQRGDLFLAVKDEVRAKAAFEKAQHSHPDDFYSHKKLQELSAVKKIDAVGSDKKEEKISTEWGEILYCFSSYFSEAYVKDRPDVESEALLTYKKYVEELRQQCPEVFRQLATDPRFVCEGYEGKEGVLHYAVRKRSERLLKLLLTLKPNVALQNDAKQTPLMLAESLGFGEGVRLLKKEEASPKGMAAHIQFYQQSKGVSVSPAPKFAERSGPQFK